MWLSVLALLVPIATSSCSEDGSCPTSSGALWLQLKGSRTSNRGVGEPDFFPVNGGVDRSCRGSHDKDDLDSHYISIPATTMNDCKQQCLSNSACKGIEYSHLSCRVWTRQQGIQASFQSAGSTCLRLLQDASAMSNFKEVDGGQGKGCRGAHPSDKQESYFKSTTASTLDECKSICVQDSECQGVSYQSRGLCEVWVRPEGIGATADDSESICLEAPPTTTTQSPSSTSAGTETTTAPIDDGWELHYGLNCYQHHGADPIWGKDPLEGRKTLQECKEECFKEQSCSGIVMPQGDGGDGPKKCWLRTNVRKSRCTAGSPYNFWARPGANIETIDNSTGIEESAPCCDGYESWPNVDTGITCAGCTALVLTEPYEGRCDKYCESFGHECFQAAEEVEENCEVKYTQSCNEPVKDTSDMLCSCRRKPRVDDPHCDWPGPPKPEKSCCKNMDQWPDVDNGVTCGDCMALVLAEKYGGRCDQYCESFGQVCIMAAEEQEENCEVKYEVPCDQAITGTSDILCKCGKSNAPPQCPVPPKTTQTTTPTPSPNKRIQVVGKQILVDGTPLHLKGVAWNPVPKGGAHPADLDFSSAVEEDAKLMKKMGINAVRTYEPITDKQVLDILWGQGIWVVNSVYNWGGADADSAAAPVKATKDHPAILMWTIGNEWNYNGLYVGSSMTPAIPLHPSMVMWANWMKRSILCRRLRFGASTPIEESALGTSFSNTKGRQANQCFLANTVRTPSTPRFREKIKMHRPKRPRN